jgi:hypothetical protein
MSAAAATAMLAERFRTGRRAMQPAVQTLVRSIRRFERLLADEPDPSSRRLLERLLEEDREELRSIPFRWGAPPTD